MTTVLPLMGFSWRQIKNDSVTLYVSFDKNNSVTPYILFDKDNFFFFYVFFSWRPIKNESGTPVDVALISSEEMLIQFSEKGDEE